MIGRLYTVAIGAQSQTAAKTLIEILAATNTVNFVERVWITQSNLDTSENTACKIQRITTTGTGTATTPEPYDPGSAAFGGTVETNSTIEPTYTSATEIIEQGFNLLSGFLWTPANDDEIILIPCAGLLGINLDVAIAGAALHYGATIRELG